MGYLIFSPIFFIWVMKFMNSKFFESLISTWRTIDELFTKLFLHQSKLENLEQIEVVYSKKDTEKNCQ